MSDEYDADADAAQFHDPNHSATTEELSALLGLLEDMPPFKALFLLEAAASYLRCEYYDGQEHLTEVIRAYAEHWADDLHTKADAQSRGLFVVEAPDEIA